MQTMMQLLALSPDWKTTNGKIQGLPISRVLWGTELAMVDRLIPASLLTKKCKLHREWPALQYIIRAPGHCPVCSSPSGEARGSCRLRAAAISP